VTLAAAVRISLLALAPAAPAVPVNAADPVRPQRFACEIRLASQVGISAPSPVTIEFTSQGKTMQGIRVLDVGGILYPGGNLSISTRPDGTVVMGAKPLPQERPGRWSGRASKRSFDLGWPL